MNLRAPLRSFSDCGPTRMIRITHIGYDTRDGIASLQAAFAIPPTKNFLSMSLREDTQFLLVRRSLKTHANEPKGSFALFSDCGLTRIIKN